MGQIRYMIPHLSLGPVSKDCDLLVDDARIVGVCSAEMKVEAEKYAEKHEALLERTHTPGPVEQVDKQEAFLQNIGIQRQAYYSAEPFASPRPHLLSI
jgi:hypothetical protein